MDILRTTPSVGASHLLQRDFRETIFVNYTYQQQCPYSPYYMLMFANSDSNIDWIGARHSQRHTNKPSSTTSSPLPTPFALHTLHISSSFHIAHITCFCLSKTFLLLKQYEGKYSTALQRDHLWVWIVDRQLADLPIPTLAVFHSIIIHNELQRQEQ